ncbi:hypothetical protein BDN71DRAFT_1347373, partial [Pleurotus eryngii]
ETKVRDTLKSIKTNGFRNLGDFLYALFDPKAAYTEQTTLQTLSAFLGGQYGEHRQPVDIVEAWYTHPRSQRGGSTLTVDTSPVIPNYSVPIESKLPDRTLTASAQGVSAHESLEMWAGQVAILIIDGESEALASEPSFRAPTVWSWDMLNNISIKSFQSKIMKLAPLTWSLFTTIAVSPLRRSQIHDAQQAITGHSKRSEAYSHQVEKINSLSNNPWSACAFMVLATLSPRNQLISLVPSLISLLFFANNTSRVVYQALGRFGICTSYSTVHDHLKKLGCDAGATIQEIGTTISRGGDHFLILFDNINKHHRVWHQTVSQADEVKSGTAATVIRMFSVPYDAMNSKHFRNNCAKRRREKLTTKWLLKDIDTNHITAVGSVTLLRIWVKYVPSLAKFSNHVAKLEATLNKHPIELHKLDIYPLRTSGIDESTTAGNSDVLRNITHSQLGMDNDDFKDLLMPVAGDQLTVDRIRKLKGYTLKDISEYSRHAWALPVIQLWHMKWAFLKAIYKAHWAPNTGKRLFGLHHDCDTLGHTKLNPTKCDFYPHHHAVTETFEISCLGVLRLPPASGSPPASQSKSTKKLLDYLNHAFSAVGSLVSKEFSFLEDLAAVAYRRYLTTAAYEDCMDDGPIPTGDADLSGSDNNDNDDEWKWKGDQGMANLALQLRDSFWYYEMCHAISHGDIGRVMEIIKILCFYFWGSGSTNYGNELLELACNFLYEYPDDLKVTLLNNWLVNPSGLPGHWHELDLLQEHHNLLIKTLFNDRNSDFDSSFLQEVIALNIRGFKQLRDFIASFFDITPNSGKHSDPKLNADINTLGACHHADDIFTFRPARTQSFIAPDFFAVGFNKLALGQLDTFIKHT